MNMKIEKYKALLLDSITEDDLGRGILMAHPMTWHEGWTPMRFSKLRNGRVRCWEKRSLDPMNPATSMVERRVTLGLEPYTWYGMRAENVLFAEVELRELGKPRGDYFWECNVVFRHRGLTYERWLSVNSDIMGALMVRYLRAKHREWGVPNMLATSLPPAGIKLLDTIYGGQNNTRYLPLIHVLDADTKTKSNLLNMVFADNIGWQKMCVVDAVIRGRSLERVSAPTYVLGSDLLSGEFDVGRLQPGLTNKEFLARNMVVSDVSAVYRLETWRFSKYE